MKKTVGLLLCGAMVLTLTACGGKTAAETLTGTAQGYGGDVSVTLARENGKITACSIKGDKETPEVGGKLTEENSEFIQALIAGQDDLSKVDTVSGATLTSTALLKAVNFALAAAQK